MELVGRNREKNRVNRLLKTQKAELVAIIGRRRVGKTYFIKEYLKQHMLLQFTGLYESTTEEHMKRFSIVLNTLLAKGQPPTNPKNWFEAFDILRTLIDTKRLQKKKVIFLDEFPWMATHKSRFLTAFTDFWNSYASSNKTLIIIICGSSASWMIDKVLRNKGGLYNRVTERIHLEPFDLYETEQFFKSRNIKLNREAIVNIYMVMGGIPFYLDQIDQGESAGQAIDRLFFAKKALLRLEYEELFTSLFKAADKHEMITQALANHREGLDRDQLLSKTKMKSGGSFSKTLDELEKSGFITAYIPFGKKKKDRIYKLTDPYTLFYFKYIKTNVGRTNGSWSQLAESSSWKSWSGLAFENTCMLHIEQVKRKLRIDGIKSIESAWRHRGDDEMPGAQIDLLIDRKDKVINICEIKYSEYPYAITKDYYARMKKKIASFIHFTKTKKTIFPTCITIHGLIDNQYKTGLVDNEVVIADLFEPSED